MKKYMPVIAVVLIFLIGLGILSYPLISSVINNMNARSEEESYLQTVEQKDTKSIKAMFRQAEKYNRGLLDTVIITDPFDVEEYKKINKKYKSILDVDGRGTIGYIKIPKIDVDLPIYHGTDEKTLAKGAGHLENTSFPIGGKGTHSVISAHSAFPGQTFFDYLTDIKKGDDFYIKVLNRTLKYKVNQIKVVLPENTSDLRIFEGKDYVTLLTCTPFSVNTHRLLVRGERVPYEEKEEENYSVIKPGDDAFFFFGFKIPYYVMAIGIAVFVLFVVLLVLLIAKTKRKGGRKKYESKA